jgi:hypothetical protein
MMVRLSAVLSLSLAGAFALAEARMMMEDFGPSFPDFEVQSRASWRTVGTRATQPGFLQGSTVAALGAGSVALDDDSGKIALLDADGKRLATASIGRGIAQLVTDPVAGRVFATDRMGDRVVVLSAGDLKVVHRFATDAEPFGLALTPDRSALLVTTVADRRVTAFDPGTGSALWSLDLIAEPRGVAVSPDGRQAAVSFVDAATVARVSLGAKPTVRYETLPAEPRRNGGSFRARHSNVANGDRFVRAAFATAFVGNDTLLVAHQTSSPRQVSDGNEVQSTYGGGGPQSMPVDHRITVLHTPGTEQRLNSAVAQFLVGTHQPRAMSYDARRDLLFVAGYGSDEVMAIANATGAAARMVWRTPIGDPAVGCGPTGLDVADDGSVLVNCSLSRRVARLPITSTAEAPTPVAGTPTFGEEIGTSRMSDEARRGRAAFRRGGDPTMSSFGVLACESCHPEGRTDGLSWRIQGQSLQTPLLVGRVAGTHPFKWDGGDANLETSLRNTVTRLGGQGITVQGARDLAAYLEQLPRPRTPTVADRGAVKRGKALFNDKSVGCARCHSGGALTDRKKHDLAMDLDGVDTPSLIGLASSAPYYHDGSAVTLRAVLTEKGSIHGMGRLGGLSDKNVGDLVAFLETL